MEEIKARVRVLFSVTLLFFAQAVVPVSTTLMYACVTDVCLRGFTKPTKSVEMSRHRFSVLFWSFSIRGGWQEFPVQTKLLSISLYTYVTCT